MKAYVPTPTHTIALDKGVPLPKSRQFSRGFNRKYPFPGMEVGDSFFAPVAVNNNIMGSIRYASRDGRKFASRRVTENGVSGIRVWRVL